MVTVDLTERILEEARVEEQKYNWLGASEFYKQASNSTSQNSHKTAEIFDRIGYCNSRAALQAETYEQFRKAMEESAQAYRKTAEFYSRSIDENRSAHVRSAEAMVDYSCSWLKTDTSEKIRLLDDWWDKKSRALSDFEVSGNQLSVARTCIDMMEGSADCRFWLGANSEEVKRKRAELISLGDRAITILSEIGSDYDLAHAYAWTSWYCLVSTRMLSVEELAIEKGLKYAAKAIEYSTKTNDAWLIGWSYCAAACGEMAKGNVVSAIRFFDRQIEQGEIAKDNYILGIGKFLVCMATFLTTLSCEDPETNRKLHERNTETVQQVVLHLQIINRRVWNGFYLAGVALLGSASIQVDTKSKYDILKKAVYFSRKGVEQTEGLAHAVVPQILNCFTWALYQLSEVESNPEKKRVLLEEALANIKKSTSILQIYQNIYMQIYNQNWSSLVIASLSNLIKDKKERINLLSDATLSIETGIKLIRKHLKQRPPEWHYSRYGDFEFSFGRIYHELFLLTKDKNLLIKAIDVYEDSIKNFSRTNLTTKVAESNWQKAKILDILGRHQQSAIDYESAAEAYQETAEKIPQLKDFYKNYSSYMKAWVQIEKARCAHLVEDHDEAKRYYEVAAKLHESIDSWSYLASNYYAWARLEEAEGQSRKENIQKAKEAFQRALDQFINAEDSIKQKITEISLFEEKELNYRLLQASDLRQKFCQARILMEEAKLLDRDGGYLQSSKSYGEAAQKISAIIEKIDVDDEKKELVYIMILCRAWEKMALAEETTSSESYLEAASLFEQAKEHCYTKKASLWALGNSSFCKGLAAGIEYQSSADLSEHAKAKSQLKNAANSYLQAGFRQASEYSKATQRLFDAYAFMNQAENELNQEKRAKHYQMAENLLQIAAGAFIKAKQPEKTAKVKLMLENVKEEKAIATSLNEVMRAPIIASTTSAFTSPSPTNEVSVGLEQFQHANVQANLIAGLREIKVGESFYLSVEFVNAGKEPALLTRIEDFVSPDFIVVEKPEIYRIEDTCLNMKGKQIAPLKLVEAKVVLQPSKKGTYQLKPTVHYLDELGQNKTLQLKTVEIKVEEVILSDRITTGTRELDSLLLGGIPNEYAVVLTGPPSDERELITKSFLEAGTGEEQTSFYVTVEAVGLDNLLRKPGFYLFLCNPKPKVEVVDLPNVHRLLGKTDLTNLNIALLKAYRNTQQSSKKRVCLDIVSDVLLYHGAEVTRRWLSELITDMGSKGFTVLAVLDPSMHPPDQANAVLNLFDGEINLSQTEDPLECKISLQVKRLRNQDYIKNPICLRP